MTDQELEGQKIYTAILGDFISVVVTFLLCGMCLFLEAWLLTLILSRCILCSVVGNDKYIVRTCPVLLSLLTWNLLLLDTKTAQVHTGYDWPYMDPTLSASFWQY